MIAVRSIVKFISKHKDSSNFIVRELRFGNMVLIESLKDGSSYVVSVDDIEMVTL